MRVFLTILFYVLMPVFIAGLWHLNVKFWPRWMGKVEQYPLARWSGGFWKPLLALWIISGTVAAINYFSL